jgi:Questin oxidase-like
VEKSYIIFQVLGSAYLFGATAEHLNDVYEAESDELESWQDAPGEITLDDWRDFLGKREYVDLNISASDPS